MGKTGKTRHGMQQNGMTERRKEEMKEDRKRVEKCKNQQRSRINKASEKIPRLDGTNPSYCFDWLEQTEALVNEHQGREKSYCSTVEPACPRPSTHCHKELQTSTSKMRY